MFREIEADVPPETPDSLELVGRQLAGVGRWHQIRHAQERADKAVQVASVSREQQLDRARRMEVLRGQHRAIIATTDAQLRDSVLLLHRGCRPRALLAHRDDWFINQLRDRLTAAGVEVLAVVHDGAEAVGVAVAEQPDLLLVEETLPRLTGAAVVAEVLACAPGTLMAGRVAHDDGVAPMLHAGACLAWPRSASAGDIAGGLLRLLDQRLLTPA